MQVNTLIQLIKSSGPRLNGKATRELHRLLDELWTTAGGMHPLDLRLIRYRRRKRLVVGTYWLVDGSLRCIAIRRNEVYLSRYLPTVNKVYPYPSNSAVDDVLNASQLTRWLRLYQVPVTTWLQRTLAPGAPALSSWQEVCSHGAIRDPEILFNYRWQGNDYLVIKRWREADATRLLVVTLEANRLVIGVISITYAEVVGFDRISASACTDLLLTV